ncbi:MULTISPECIES: TadE/TadG family type IV pilus assembly protein [unclassified Streptomyces]|uniref:TadE/TadG family type IV pilus assembly protein n=1 Tax=unclassified Streptomyces TaxID=2593676 RepID=UPI000DD638A7|nr:MULTISPECIES: TadE/TadG family type IV pilus assembly protein [unclassified Streptomyces]QZZ25557.1 pilus assembly protein TadE [Streptomyces sp. ST1015]
MPAAQLRRLRGDRGAVTTELVIVMPLLLTLVMLLAQATVWWHAVHIAQTAATQALAATRVQDGTTASGRHEARRVLGQLGPGPLHDVRIAVTRTADRADVRITGTATSVVPFLHLPVDTRAAGPVERFRPAQAAP